MMSDTKKSFDVVAAIIQKDGKIFAAQRAYGELKGKWEFPGGKIETGETGPEALVREIFEELGSEIKVDRLFTHIDYEYPSFYLHMDVYLCTLKKGDLAIEEGIHESEQFIAKDSMMDLEWCPADRIVAERFVKQNQ